MRKNGREKETKLANQIGVVTGGILIFVFVLLIGVTITLATSSVNKAVDDALFENADNTANRIENVFFSASTVAENMETYLEKAYEMEGQGAGNMAGEKISAEDSRAYHSMLYGIEISELNADVEKYLIETARATVLGDNSVMGVGVMFEPYKYDSNIESYAFYIDASVGKNGNVEPFGEYEEYSKEEYYQKAYETKKAVYTEPYEYNGQMVITCAVPVLYNNEVQGIIMSDVLTDDFANFISKNEQYPSMYTTIYNAEHIDIYDSETADDVGHSMDEFYKNKKQLQSVKSQMENGEPFSIVTTREDGRNIARYFSPVAVGTEVWWAMSALDQSDKNQAAVQMVIIMIVIAILSLAVIVGAIIYILKKKLSPIDDVLAVAEQIAKGNLDAVISMESKDEIGKLGKAFQNTIDEIKRIIEDIDFVLGAMAEGNFAIKTKAAEAYVGDYENILLSMRKLNKNLSSTLLEITEASSQVALGSEQMAESAQSLAEGATEQAGAVEELTATIENVSATAITSAEQAEKAYQQSNEFVREAEHSNEEMAKLNQAMGRISETSKQIEQIIAEIEDIASQTNLLSLNASIEAARAGEAGKGFAVVADQIGKLAADSAQSAVNTRNLISKALEEVNAGNEMTANTSQSLIKVIDGIKVLAQASKDTSAMSVSQADIMKQVEQGIEQISSVVQNNSAAAQETSATSEELSAQADSLQNLVGKFELEK